MKATTAMTVDGDVDPFTIDSIYVCFSFFKEMEHLRPRGNEIMLARGKYTVGYENYLREQYNGRFESRLNSWVFPSRMKYKLASFIQNIDEGRVIGNIEDEEIQDVDIDLDIFQQADRVALYPGKSPYRTETISEVPLTRYQASYQEYEVIEEDPNEEIQIFNPFTMMEKFDKALSKLDRQKQILYSQAYKSMLLEGCRYPQWIERDVRKYAIDAGAHLP